MKLHKILILLLAVAATAFSAGAAASFELIPPRNVVQGRNFVITFRLTNADGNAPEAPELNGCSLLYGPAVSTMMSTEIVNGRMSSSRTKDFSFTYRADEPGTVTVPAMAVGTDEGTLRSRGASFTILPPDDTQQASDPNGGGGQQGARRQGGQQVQQPQGGRVSADDLLVRVFFSKSSVYEQEPVVATIKIYTKYDITSFLPVVQPAFEGFLTEELPVDMNVDIENYNGQNYHCAVLKRLLLYPQRSGRLTVNSGKYDVTIVQYETVNMGFFQTHRPIEKQITTSSNGAAIQVKPLPEPKPAGFNGAVGQFAAEVSLDPELMRTNEPSVYSYKVTGTGNIKYLSPAPVDFPAGMESYTPRTNMDTRIINGGTNMSGTFTTEFTIVPTEVGNYTIAGVPMVFFNPADGQYHTAEVRDLDVHVLRGNAASAPVDAAPIDAEINDILHIHASDISRQRQQIDYVGDSTAYWLAYVLLTLILLGAVLLYRHQIRLNADVSGRRLAKAGRVAAKRLKAARAAMGAGKPDEFYASLSSALWGYLGDKLAIPASQLTRDNIAGKLADYGIPEDSTDSVIEVLDQCEMARFTPSGSQEQMEDIYKQASRAIDAMENVKKK